MTAPSHEQIAEMMREQQRTTMRLWDQLALSAPTAEMREFCRTQADLYDTQGEDRSADPPAGPLTAPQPAPSSENRGLTGNE